MASALPACRSATSRCSCFSRMADQGELANHSSRRLLTPFEALHPDVSAAHPALASGSHRRPRRNRAATPMSISCSSAHTAKEFLQQAVPPACQGPPMAFRRLRRTVPRSDLSFEAETSRTHRRGHPLDLPGLFHPDNARELWPSGLWSRESAPPRLRGSSSRAVLRWLSHRARLRRFHSLRDRRSGFWPSLPCPPGLSPRRLSLPLP